MVPVANALITLGMSLIVRGFYAGRSTKTPKARTEQPMPTVPLLQQTAPARNVQINRTFENQELLLDGFNWIDCTFRNCNFIVERGDFELHDNHITDCKLTFRGNAETIIRTANMFFPQIPLIEKQSSLPQSPPAMQIVTAKDETPFADREREDFRNGVATEVRSILHLSVIPYTIGTFSIRFGLARPTNRRQHYSA